MELFSHRQGYKKIRDELQTDSFDQETSNKLWDIISAMITNANCKDLIQKFLKILYVEVLNKTADATPKMYLSTMLVKGTSYEELKFHWFENFTFNQKMDAIEILACVFNGMSIQKEFNEKFKELLVPYRILENRKIIKVDSEEEYKAIEQATKETGHIDKVAGLLFDRKNPDYRNSIKESILAVEEVCGAISGSSKDFKPCVDIIGKKMKMHEKFKDSLKNMYDFCSDEKGVRHSGSTQSDIDFEDAKFVLVFCSSAINYLKEKEVKLKST